MQKTYIENGLLYFHNLKDKKLQIATTYDNKVWGNMNPAFSKNEEEREGVREKDRKLADILGFKTSFSFKTPNEDSMIDFDERSVKYIGSLYPADEKGYKDILLATNSMLVYPQEERYGYIVAPRDCSVVVIAPKDFHFALIMHLGAPQLLTGLHRKSMKMLMENKDSFGELDMYITPYIGKGNYSVSLEKGERYASLYGEGFEKYVETKFSDIWQEERCYVDFVGAFKDEVRNVYGIKNVIDSDIDNYDETKNGHLYSYKYARELQMRKEKGEDISDDEIDEYNKGFNVVVSL